MDPPVLPDSSGFISARDLRIPGGRDRARGNLGLLKYTGGGCGECGKGYLGAEIPRADIVVSAGTYLVWQGGIRPPSRGSTSHTGCCSVSWPSVGQDSTGFDSGRRLFSYFTVSAQKDAPRDRDRTRPNSP